MTHRHHYKYQAIAIRRSSDGSPLHPAHSQFHLLRLLAGSIIGGWSIMLTFIALGFLGTIDFVDSTELALRWILIGGSIVGIILGVIFALIAALLINIIPPLKRSVHPLSLVRAGFLVITVYPLAALAFWPSSTIGIILAPIIAILIAWAGIATNPHADLVPHSTIGRGLGTAIGPAMLLAFMLIILVPMFHRGYGVPRPPKLIMVAVDGIDSSYASQILNSPDSGRYPNLTDIQTTGGYGMLNSDRPVIASRLWGSIMTGEKASEHGILDRNSTAEDLVTPTLWEILNLHGYSVGLFQVPPPHYPMERAIFEIPIPDDSSIDPAAQFIGQIRATGRDPGLPMPWEIGFAACRLARLGVKLETISALGEEYLWETVMRPSPRLIYARRKLLEFRIDTDRALASMRKNPAEVAILRFDSLEPLLMYYWRYIRPNEFSVLPSDVDAALAGGLGYVVPDTYRAIDDFIGDLENFRDPNTVLAIVSNHGIRTESDSRRIPMHLSPEKFIEALGSTDEIVGDFSSNGICIRPVSNSLDSLIELDQVILDAESALPDELESTRVRTRVTFNTTWYDNCLEISVPVNPDLTREAIITMGDWTGPMSDLLIDTETPSGQIAGNALFLIVGPHFRNREVARNPQVYDIAPTLLHSIGVPISEEFAGRVLDELFNPQWLGENPIEYVTEYAIPDAVDDTADTYQPSVPSAEDLVQL